MHSEHRHQLQQNDFEQLLLKAVPWLQKHGMQLVIALGVAAVVLIAGMVWWSMSYAASAEAWSELALAERDQVKSVEKFGDVAARFPGTLAAAWANLRSAELNFESGVTALFRDRELGLKDLKAAKEQFDAVLSSPVSLPENLQERAMFGLARVIEATSDGDMTSAVEAYERVLTRFPESIYKTQIETRIAELKTGGASEFYAWFHAEKPEPAAFPRPQDGARAPEGGSTVPPNAPFGLPPVTSSTTPATSADTPATNEPAASSPADSTAPPAGEKPVTPAPAENNPAENTSATKLPENPGNSPAETAPAAGNSPASLQEKREDAPASDE